MLTRTAISRAVDTALEEDLGRGDVTTDAIVEPGAHGRAIMRARQALVFCGAPLVLEVFAQVDELVEVTALCEEGARLEPGAAALEVEGPAASILKGERVALNFVQRLSGVATLTRAHVDALTQGSRARITDTRKTTPGLRALERYAVRVGGGHNHRQDLASAILIKDNHIAAAGGIAAAVKAARTRGPHTSRITCEVDDMDQLDEALTAGVDVILVDNFDDQALVKAVARVDGRTLLEASGGVTLARVAAISAAGVDVMSIGALTHSAPAVDLGLDWTSAE